VLLTVFMYLAAAAFAGFSLYKVYLFAQNPLNNRWELYPVPGELGTRGSYGGSYYEEAEWWARPRQVSHTGVYREMLKESLFMRNLFVNRRKHWRLSYAMHLGIYLLVFFTFLLLAGAITELSGLRLTTLTGAGNHPWARLVYFATSVTGACGASLTAFGSASLLFSRVLDGTLRKYTDFDEYFNLCFILAAAVSGLIVWSTDPGFNYGREVVTAMLTFAPIRGGTALTVHILLFGALLIYIPRTKMSHYIGKYFAYHKVLWDNEPNLSGSVMEEKVRKSLEYIPQDRWSAPHVNSAGRQDSL